MSFQKNSLLLTIFFLLGCEQGSLLGASIAKNPSSLLSRATGVSADLSGKPWGFDRKKLGLLAVPCLLGVGALALQKKTQKNSTQSSSPVRNNHFLSHPTLSAAFGNQGMPRELESIMLEYSQLTEEDLTRKRLVNQNEGADLVEGPPFFYVRRHSTESALSIVDSFSLEPLIQITIKDANITFLENYNNSKGSIALNEKYCAMVVRFNARKGLLERFSTICVWDRASGTCFHQLPIPLSSLRDSMRGHGYIALSDDGKWVAFYDFSRNQLIRWDLRCKEPQVYTTELVRPFLEDVAGITILADGSVWLSFRDPLGGRPLSNIVWKHDQQDAQAVTDSPAAQMFAQCHLLIRRRSDLNPQRIYILQKGMLGGCNECPALRPFAEYYAQRLNNELNKQVLWSEKNNQGQQFISSRLCPDDPWIKGHLLEINNLLDPNMPKPALDIIEKFIASAPQHVRGYLLDISGVDRGAYFQKYPSVTQCTVTSHIPPTSAGAFLKQFLYGCCIRMISPWCAHKILTRYNWRLSQYLSKCSPFELLELGLYWVQMYTMLIMLSQNSKFRDNDCFNKFIYRPFCGGAYLDKMRYGPVPVSLYSGPYGRLKLWAKRRWAR